MATVDFFSTVQKSFVDVPVDADKNNAIDTTSFLEASESLTKLFDVLGSAAFKPVKNDIQGNVTKVRTRQLAAPAESSTLQSLVLTELGGKSHTATEGLLWLTRGLDFTAQALRHNIDNSASELADSFRDAYGKTLKPHHSFIIKPIFSAAMSATPYRKDFYAKLGPDPAKVEVELNAWLTGLEERLAILKEFMNSKQAQWK